MMRRMFLNLCNVVFSLQFTKWECLFLLFVQMILRWLTSSTSLLIHLEIVDMFWDFFDMWLLLIWSLRRFIQQNRLKTSLISHHLVVSLILVFCSRECDFLIHTFLSIFEHLQYVLLFLILLFLLIFLCLESRLVFD